jgi:two-component system NarL family response regulator
MPGLDGMEVIPRVRRLFVGTRVLVLSMHNAAEYVRTALRVGASGYVVKGAGLDDVVHAIRTVAAGERFLDAQAALALGDALEPPAGDELALLTARERQVLQLVAQGLTNRLIGEQLGCSMKTIDVHRTNLMRKLQLHSVAALTRFAVRHGLVAEK